MKSNFEYYVMGKSTLIEFFAVLVTLTGFSQIAFGDAYEEKLDFATSLDETLGHFWAIEQNLDEGNAELALVHATHPIAELYDLMKPELSQYDPELDSKVQDTLLQLQNKATSKVSREQAQIAIDEAKETIELARSAVVGKELDDDPKFQAKIIRNLMETSISEYREAVSEGMILEMAEFQDGSAFVWRSEQIFKEIESEIDSPISKEIEEYYEDLWNAYEKKSDPEQVEIFARGIIHEIDEVLETQGEDVELLEYVGNIQELLEQTKTEYANGNTDVALSLATRAYLDNYEFLEAPLIELGHEDLMEEVEVMLREELREMIRNGQSSEEINSQVDLILEKMNTIATVVPEFGTIAMMILAMSILSIIVVTSKSKFNQRI